MDRYTPGEVVEQTGFSLDTLRYYERIGLLSDIGRTAGGQRVFTDGDVGWLGILRCLRDTGMPINRMQAYAELARGGDETLPDRIALLEEHDRAVEKQIEQLDAQRKHLRGKIDFYRSVIDASSPSTKMRNPSA